jgi:hypothetical protein
MTTNDMVYAASQNYKAIDKLLKSKAFYKNYDVLTKKTGCRSSLYLDFINFAPVWSGMQ